jgi:hypothetical protein
LGLNPVFREINYGVCSNDTYTVSNDFFDLMKIYYLHKLISTDDFENLMMVKRTVPKGILEFEIVKSIIRKYTVLRWTAREIINGYKKLFDGKSYFKYTIEEAVCDKSQINIEGIFISDTNIYNDVSNFFVLEYEADGKKHLLNLSDDALYDKFDFRNENLRQSMYTLMYSHMSPNLFKAVKRMLSWSRTFKNDYLLEQVYPIINSQLGVLYNITSQLKTIMKIIKEHGSKYMRKEPIYNQLDIMRSRLQELIFVNYDFSHVYSLINVVLSRDEGISQSKLYEDLDEITKHLLTFLNQQTLTELKKIGLYPLPPYLQPKNKPF